MGNLLASLLNTSNALRVYSQALTVSQNNVVNASTPGYAKQTQGLEAMPFDVTVGLPGGVMAGPVLSARDGFAEKSVREQQTALDLYQQKTTDLTPLETYFDLSGTSGIGPDISGLFQRFSQLSVSPNDAVARQGVIDQANTVAQSFRNTAMGLAGQGTSLDQESRSTIDSINRLAGIIAEVNAHNRVDPSGSVDAGVDAQLNSALEEMSQLVNFTALQQPDGTIAVYLGGQSPLVSNDQVYAIHGDFSTAQTAIVSSTGADLTPLITGGKLSALLDDNNNLLPAYMKDLNTLAENLASQVNTTLANGVDQNGAAPVTDLFQYDAATGAALTLSVNPVTPDQIAAALPGAAGGNGNALALAKLANAKTVDGYTFAQFYGNLGGRVGRDLSEAKDTQSTKQQLLSQAQALRQQVSGVSLDEEAEHLVAFQRAYEATSKMMSILNSLTDTLMKVIP
ncbi:MAG TPA: flagellar hook-associated protein FlgK [Bryobacteraceae bacterium]|nr:flagellar hook-associated protein FlgK [Bryobacteraceae bacterium]